MSGQQTSVRTALTHAGRSVLPESTQANPRLRQVIADRREIAAMTRDRVSSPFTAIKFYALTTPGKLAVLLFAMVAACLLTGWYSSSTLNDRSQTLESLIDRSEPLAESAEVLYSSLSVADAAANSAFISGGRESPELRTQYADAVASSGTALVASADGGSQSYQTGPAAGIAVRTDLDTVAVQLPTYTGVIETARTNNRLGNPVGSAYLVQASSLMQGNILPAAKRVYDQRSAALSEPQRTLTVPPWGVYVALFGVIGMLIACGRYLARRTRRHFNIGLIAALTALGVGTLWLLITGLTSVAAANTAKNAGAEPLHELTTMRILTQQARSSETLNLVRRSDPGQLDRDFTSAVAAIGSKTNQLLAADADPGVTEPLHRVQESLGRWQRAHDEVNQRLASGDFVAARALTIGAGDISTATGYQEVNDALLEAIDQTRGTFRSNITAAQQLLGYTGTGIGWLCVVAAVAVAAGLFPRIREYR